MSFSCGDHIILPDDGDKIVRVCIMSRWSRRMQHVLSYLKYDVFTGRSSIETELGDVHLKYQKDEGEPGYIGEKIRCLRQRVTGQVLRKYLDGDILFCETEMGNYFVTHRMFAIDFIDTRLCDEIPSKKRIKPSSEEDEELQWPTECPS